MSEFNEKDYTEYNLDNFGSREKNEPFVESVNAEPLRRTDHSARTALNLKKLLMFAVPAAVILIALIIVIIVLISKPKNEYFGYLKDGEIFLTTVKNGAGAQITEDFLLDDGISSTSIFDYTRMSNDGKKIFYIDKYDGSSRNLYYREIDGKDTASHKLSSDVDYYDINDKGTVVTYIKDDVDLFQHDLNTQSDKIDTDVSYFLSSNDGKKILYLKDNNDEEISTKDLYYYAKGKETKCIAKNVETVRYISDDFSLVYYVSDSVLYKLEVDKSPKEIASDVSDVINIYDSGDVYFSKIDDQSKASLYFYNGKETVKVLDNYYRTELISKLNPALVVNYAESDSISYSVVVGSKVSKINHSVISVNLSDDGSEIYILADLDTKTMLGSLYKAKITSELKEIKKVSDGVAYGKYISDDLYVYMKDYEVETGTGTLYAFGKEIAKDVSWNSILYSEKYESLYFFTDKKDNNGTLNCYKSGKTNKVMKDVRIDSLNINQNNDVLFLHDFKNGEGILYAIKKGKTIKVDYDVSKIIVFMTNDEYDLLAKSYF